MFDSHKFPLSAGHLTDDDVRAVSPALEYYTKGPLLNNLWKRPELSTRDRSIVTVAAVIARIQTIEMTAQFALALDNGVKPAELSEIITHLAFYAGWGNAITAIAAAKQIFHQLDIGADQLPPAKETLLPLNQEAESQRATQVANNFGAVSPGLVENTTNLLFRDLWLRPALAPRDRSLCNGAGIGPSLKAATVFDRGDPLIKQWPRRSSISLKVTAGASILTWRNFSIESTTTN